MNDGLRFAQCILFGVIVFLSCSSIQSTIPAFEKYQDTIFLYISVNGNDGWTGEFPSKDNHQGPLATFHSATRKIKEIRHNSPDIPIVVEISEGDYPIDSSILISGLKGSPVVFRPYKDAHVSIFGGITVKDFEPVSKEFLNQLDSLIYPHIRQIDLSKAGIKDPGTIEPRGFPREEYPSPVELFINGHVLQLARWPNEEWAYIKGVPGGRYSGRVSYADENINRWKSS